VAPAAAAVMDRGCKVKVEVAAMVQGLQVKVVDDMAAMAEHRR